MIQIYQPVIEMAAAFSRMQAPHETCGIMWSTGIRGAVIDDWMFIVNVADEPRTTFRMDPKQQLRQWQRLEDLGLKPALVWHSHPIGDARPSRTDVEWISDPPLALIIALRSNQVGLWRRDELGQAQAVPFEIVAPKPLEIEAHSN